MIESLHLWRDRRTLGDADTGFRVTGITFLNGRVAGDAEAHQTWLDQVRPYGLDSRMLSGAEVKAVLPEAAQSWSGALYTPSDGGAEPERAAPARRSSPPAPCAASSGERGAYRASSPGVAPSV